MAGVVEYESAYEYEYESFLDFLRLDEWVARGMVTYLSPWLEQHRYVSIGMHKGSLDAITKNIASCRRHSVIAVPVA